MSFLDGLWDTVRGAAPSVAGTLAGTLTGIPAVGGAVAGIVRGICGGDGNDQSPLTELEAQAVQSNPDLLLEFKKQMADLEVRVLQEETKRLSIVNETMRAEANSESKAQRGWRPFNGYMFGITLFSDYFLSQIALAFMKVSVEWTHIPDAVYMLWSTVLGVSVASRGMEKAGGFKGMFGKK